MKFILMLFLTGCFFIINTAFAQVKQYSVANAHSHNDYEQINPFFEAYGEQFGSIEADIFLMKNGHILVAHDTTELTEKRTLENMYLLPLLNEIKKNGGYAYKDSSKNLQLLIDVKTDSISTLNALINVLQKYPLLINNKTVHIVITGNRPPVENFSAYPDYILFDANAGKNYSKAAMSKIAMFSTYFGKYSKWTGKGAIPFNDDQQIKALILNAHQVNKPIRFWGCPDFEDAWITLINLQADFINTDHIKPLASFLKNRIIANK